MSEITGAHLTTDIVLIAHHKHMPHVLLIRRGWDPFAGSWALPGGYVDQGERFAEAAARELREETGLHTANLTQVGVFDDPDRDPRGRVVSVAFGALLDHVPAPVAGDDARDARWVPLSEALNGPLAFDHHEVLAKAHRVLTTRLVEVPSHLAEQIDDGWAAYSAASDAWLAADERREVRPSHLRSWGVAARLLSDAYGLAGQREDVWSPLAAAFDAAFSRYEYRAEGLETRADRAEQHAAGESGEQ
ncbi:NUDIX hydrolase [Saccharopolyspora sp. 6M]|uniref:NUDIX domain-containing protein n=1 Tax=Saccharopolyspora sp. 6M TaxID=2877237 RepID=UPI001CD58D2E|nr:NUDIX hydrolase [Saccharopolyspora sp. 6M]MCA1228650.1 NUDIX hydrolase [Saccharopolyspora sp. 6M]